ncbi:bifunctional diguanylate cyclase/phosphodiesterase [Clostridium sp. AN503]|uniref:sensor domain-containing phosphodiesterase n=1 Tax=Clostridium sp. AN503 TaxID=3160598 RepID=UPI00345AB77A
MTHEEYDSLLMDRSGYLCYICDTETYETLHLTRAAMDLYGLKSPEEYTGRQCYDLLQGLDSPCPFCPNSKLKHGENYCWEHYNTKLDRWLAATDTLLTIEGRSCKMEVANDITQQKEQVSQLSDRLSIESALIECVGILAHEKDMKAAINHFLETIGHFYQARRAYIFEFDPENTIMNNTFEWCDENVSREINNLQEIPIEYASDWLKMFEEKGNFSISSLHKELDPSEPGYRILNDQGIEKLLAAPFLKGEKITGFLGVDDPCVNSTDLTLLRAASDFIMEELEKRRLMSDLEYASFTDLLTGLKNRNQYIRVLSDYSRTPPDSLGVIFIDINGMKKLNDTYGHSFGDYVIIRVASILKEHLTDNLFRIGGDEFVALYPNISKEEFEKKVLNLRREYDADKDCDVSLGYTWSSGELDVVSQIRQADELMYAEKQSYYHSILCTGRMARTGMASEVLQEIKNDRFVVFYQPQFHIKSQKIIGAEALVRKKDNDGVLIPPDRFIPFYELEGVIRHVDLYVLETVCTNLQKWMSEDIPLRISVNFSRVTLMEPDIVKTILDICRRYGVPSSYIMVEVTESISKMDHEQLKRLVHDLAEAGFTISLDDFGSKYSNLSILTALDFNEIKFDKTLVDELEKNPKSQVVMQNSIHICRDLKNTHSIAEGIETRGQLDLLLDYACDYGQGYYFSRPLSEEQFSKLLKEQAKSR